MKKKLVNENEFNILRNIKLSDVGYSGVEDSIATITKCIVDEEDSYYILETLGRGGGAGIDMSVFKHITITQDDGYAYDGIEYLGKIPYLGAYGGCSLPLAIIDGYAYFNCGGGDGPGGNTLIAKLNLYPNPTLVEYYNCWQKEEYIDNPSNLENQTKVVSDCKLTQF